MRLNFTKQLTLSSIFIFFSTSISYAEMRTCFFDKIIWCNENTECNKGTIREKTYFDTDKKTGKFCSWTDEKEKCFETDIALLIDGDFARFSFANYEYQHRVNMKTGQSIRVSIEKLQTLIAYGQCW